MPASRRSLLSHLPQLAALLGALTVALAVSQGSALAATHHSRKGRRSSSAHASHPAGKSHTDATPPPEGIWDNCDLNTQLTTCEQRLSVIAKGGFKVVVMALFGNEEANLQAYAAYAQSVGMSVMWEIDDPGFWGGEWTGSSAANDFTQFAQACGCTSSSGVFDAMIGFLAGLPGTYGYYAADDSAISPGQTSGLRSYVDAIKAIDPNHMVMIGANPGQGQSNASSGAVLGNEIYPVTTSNIQNAGRNLAAWDTVQQQVQQGQSSATRNAQPSAFILQAFTFGDNLDDGEAVGACTASMSQQQCYQQLLYPSRQAQLELRNAVLQYSHPKLILWYSFEGTYGQAGDDTYSIYPTGATAQARWSGLTAAIKAPPPTVQATAARAHARRVSAKRDTGHHRTHG